MNVAWSGISDLGRAKYVAVMIINTFLHWKIYFTQAWLYFITLLFRILCGISSVFLFKSYILYLVEIEEYADQYLENRLNSTELNITMYTAVYHLIEYLTKGS